MNGRAIVSKLSTVLVKWLKKYRMTLLVACIIFFLLMYINIPGFQAGPFDKVVGSVILAAGLINFTFWTLQNREASRTREIRKIKGRRKS